MPIEEWLEEQFRVILTRRKLDKSYDRGYVDALLDVRNRIRFMRALTKN